MKKSPWIVCCLAALFVGQITAFAQSTTAVYSVIVSNVFSVSTKKGTKRVDKVDTATATFLNNGSCSVEVGSSDLTGSYTVSPKTNDIVFTRDDTSVLATSNNLVALLYSNGVPSDVTISLKALRGTDIKLGKNDEPITPKAAATDTIIGTLSGTNKHGKVVTKGFSLKTYWIDWLLTSGSPF